MLLSLSYQVALASEHAADVERGKVIFGAMVAGLVVSLFIFWLMRR